MNPYVDSLHREVYPPYDPAPPPLHLPGRIQQDIQEGNYAEAISNMLLLCCKSSNFQDIQKIYSLLNALLSHVNQEGFLALRETVIPYVLNTSSHYPELQKQLALHLADWHIKQAELAGRVTPYSYLETMHYYAKALKIAEEHQLEERQHIYCLASRLFMKLICYYVVKSERIKHMLERVIGKGEDGKLAFDQGLEQIKALGGYISVGDDYKVIEDLYRQARDVFHGISQSSKPIFEPLGEKIIKGLNPAYFLPYPRPLVQRYQEAIQRFRNYFKEERNKIKDSTDHHAVREFQKEATNKLKAFFNELLYDAFAILGSPPCPYDLRAMGSFGRQEICPYSDLEWMILIQDPLKRPYFKNLAELIELQVVSLGETAATNLPVFTCLGQQNRSGFHIDTGGNPAQQENLIEIPSLMASHQKPKEQACDYRSVESSLLKTESLRYGDLSLFKDYEAAYELILNQSLSPSQGTDLAKTVRQKQALDFIKKRLNEYKETWKFHFEQQQILNMKAQYVELLNYPLSDFALYYGIKAKNTFDVVDTLAATKVLKAQSDEMTVLTAESCLLIKQAIAFIYMTRVRLHLAYGEQKEEGKLVPQVEEHLIAFEQEEKEKLAEIYWLVLKPLFSQVERALNQTADISSLQISLTLNAHNLQGKTPLHQAVMNGEQGAVVCLLRRGADITALTKCGKNILHLAAQHGCEALLSYCLDHIQKHQGVTVLVTMLNQGEREDGRLPIHNAVWGTSKPGIVKIFLDYGVDPNVRQTNQFVYTPLHWAAKHGHLESAKLLLERGADSSLMNFNEDTPLDLALRHGQDDLFLFFIDPQNTWIFENPPQNIDDLESYYHQQFEKAYEEDDGLKQLFFLEKQGDLLLQKKAYKQAAHVLNAAFCVTKRYQFKSYQPLVLSQLERIEGLLIKEIWGANMPHRGYIAQHRDFLQTVRENAQQQLENKVAIKKIQIDLTNHFKDLLRLIISKSIESIMQSPPNFAVFGLGSMARLEMSAYSDVAFSYLLEEDSPENREYFRKLSQLIELKILNLGETEFNILRSSKKDGEEISLTFNGFSLNEKELSPFGKPGLYELIGSAENLANYQSQIKDNILTDSALTISYIMGKLDLIEKYESAVRGLLHARQGGWIFGPRLNEVRALDLLREHQQALKSYGDADKIEMQSFNITKEWYRPLQGIISGLALYYSIKEKNSFAILKQLEKKKILSQTGEQNLTNLLREIQKLRLRSHLFYRNRSDFLIYSSSINQENASKFLYIDEQLSTVISYCFRVLIPLYQAIDLFLKGDKKALRGPLIKNDLQLCFK